MNTVLAVRMLPGEDLEFFQFMNSEIKDMFLSLLKEKRPNAHFSEIPKNELQAETIYTIGYGAIKHIEMKWDIPYG